MKTKEHAPITEFEAKAIDRANTAGSKPVVFVHGLWLLPSSWDRWAELFEKNGYTALTPGWPDDPDTVARPRRNPRASPTSPWVTSRNTSRKTTVDGRRS